MSPSLFPMFLGTSGGEQVTKIYTLSSHRSYKIPEQSRIIQITEELIKNSTDLSGYTKERIFMVGNQERIVYIPEQKRIIQINDEKRTVSA